MAMFRQLIRQGVTAQRISAVSRLYATGGTTAPGHTVGATKQTQNFNKDMLKQLVGTNKVVIFMKGNPDAPKCGFSNAVVQILHMHGVEYDAHDVLQSDELRQGIKEFTDWPTIPQIFINGEFVGGCDILLQMHRNGDLVEELKKVGIVSRLLKEHENAEQQSTTDGTKKGENK